MIGKSALSLIFVAAFITACSSMESPPRRNPRIGMTKTEAERSTWGKPFDYYIHSMETRYGRTECWFYPDYSHRSICFNEYDKITTITE